MARSASAPLPLSSIDVPGPAASIINPMIERPDTEVPFFATTISAAN